MKSGTIPFIKGEGEMSTLTRQFDWATTSVGNPDRWPQSLISILNVILSAKLPMFLYWGADYIQFYNDAIIPSLGMVNKHPSALGQRGAVCWPELWPQIQPMIDQVLAGESNTVGTINRNGLRDNLHGTFSYSPVWDETGQVAGVLRVGHETTWNVETARSLQERYQFATEAAQFGVWEVDMTTGMVHWDDRCGELFCLPLSNSMSYEQALAKIHPDDVAQVTRVNELAMDPLSGGYYDLTYRVIGPGDGQPRWGRFRGQAYFDAAGKPCWFGGVAQNVTKEIEARQQLEAGTAKLRLIFEQAPVGIAIVRGPELIFELVNERYKELTGRAASVNLVGQPFGTGLPQLQEPVELLRQVMRTGKALVFNEYKVSLLRKGQRETCYFNVVGEPLYDRSDRTDGHTPAGAGDTAKSPERFPPFDGYVSGVFVTITEVTNSVQVRQRVEANAAYLQRVFRQAAVGIAIFLGPDFIIEVANPEMCAIWGRSEDDVLGKPMLEALPELAGQGFDTLLADIRQTGQPFVGKELPATFNRNGELAIIYFDLAFEPLPEDDGRVNRVLVTACDVTERWQARQQVEQLLVRERELNELKSNFITLASHEFRTPMTTILSSAGLIRRYNDADDRAKHERHVQRIESAVDSLTGLLDDFLALSQMAKQSLYNHPYALHIGLFCEEIIENIRGVIKPGQRVVYRHLAGESAILIDGQLLNTILINLLVNASKYSADAKEIELTTTVQADQLLISVKDEGIGIPEEDKDKLFVNFFRASNVTHVQGTGLGLYVVKRYVELLGGRITFTSQLNAGTIFSVQLPLSPLPLLT